MGIGSRLDEAARQRFGLRANLWDSGGFKQFSPARRTQREQRSRRVPPGVYQCAGAVGSESDSKVVGACHAVRHQSTDERTRTVVVVFLNARAVDDPVDFEFKFCRLIP